MARYNLCNLQKIIYMARGWACNMFNVEIFKNLFEVMAPILVSRIAMGELFFFFKEMTTQSDRK